MSWDHANEALTQLIVDLHRPEPKMELRNLQHVYKYDIDLPFYSGGVWMRIFEIQILFTKRLANVENVISVLFRAECEGDYYLHEWYGSWHDFPTRFKEVDERIRTEISILKLVHPEFREGYQPEPLKQ